MSWEWRIKFMIFGWALLLPNLEDYPEMKYKWGIGRSSGKGYWSCLWKFL